MTKLEEVRAKVIEAVPEIVELKYGCLVEGKEKRSGKKIAGRFVWFGGEGDVVVDNFALFKNDGDLKIIGRPITLADVLRTMHKATKLTRYYLTLNGGFMRIGTSWVLVQWSLALPLDEQEPEVVEFLHGVLVGSST